MRVLRVFIVAIVNVYSFVHCLFVATKYTDLSQADISSNDSLAPYTHALTPFSIIHTPSHNPLHRISNPHLYTPNPSPSPIHVPCPYIRTCPSFLAVPRPSAIIRHRHRHTPGTSSKDQHRFAPRHAPIRSWFLGHEILGTRNPRNSHTGQIVVCRVVRIAYVPQPRASIASDASTIYHITSGDMRMLTVYGQQYRITVGFGCENDVRAELVVRVAMSRCWCCAWMGLLSWVRQRSRRRLVYDDDARCGVAEIDTWCEVSMLCFSRTGW
jgi:hypothetical protein